MFSISDGRCGGTAKTSHDPCSPTSRGGGGGVRGPDAVTGGGDPSPVRGPRRKAQGHHRREHPDQTRLHLPLQRAAPGVYAKRHHWRDKDYHRA